MPNTAEIIESIVIFTNINPLLVVKIIDIFGKIDPSSEIHNKLSILMAFEDLLQIKVDRNKTLIETERSATIDGINLEWYQDFLLQQYYKFLYLPTLCF